MLLRRRNRRRSERPAIEWPTLDINWRAVGASIGIVALLAGGYAISVRLLNRPIDALVVNGAFRRVSALHIESIVQPYARAGFLDVKLGALRRELVALPWVADAEIRRRWPGTLLVDVREESPVACWGERGLLNAEGELFLPAAEHVPAELPRLHGPAGTEAQVTARYFQVQRQLEHRGLAAIAMNLDARGAWTFTVSNGLQVRLGALSVDQRIERFFKVLDSTLAQRPGEVAYVDMRYPNGFAIGWKDGAAAATAESATERPHV